MLLADPNPKKQNPITVAISSSLKWNISCNVAKLWIHLIWLIFVSEKLLSSMAFQRSLHQIMPPNTCSLWQNLPFYNFDSAYHPWNGNRGCLLKYENFREFSGHEHPLIGSYFDSSWTCIQSNPLANPLIQISSKCSMGWMPLLELPLLRHQQPAQLEHWNKEFSDVQATPASVGVMAVTSSWKVHWLVLDLISWIFK